MCACAHTHPAHTHACAHAHTHTHTHTRTQENKIFQENAGRDSSYVFVKAADSHTVKPFQLTVLSEP